MSTGNFPALFTHVANTDPSRRIGAWMSQDKRHHHDFVNKTVDHVDKHPKELLPVLKEFKEMVENDSRLFMLFESMFDQVRSSPSPIALTSYTDSADD